ncbi:unnamed protein product [Penicillium salamii]|uniref:Uncharacterized protein n=1 Tax=Penicillium salamii TaxID=1612424 RepID=A0A9W4JST3_9EURO|nr:unnamed protein product [Penicillium salamii]CAG8302275.1 unnamed protein product [Penicillium salamii]CAG8354476.1 unnamed protein product [Penicillium salamii]CAG8360157.1 unnamed protein product [Penicillium salamii]CAG8367454.1 unnamed protein product [Penicillium salamii]
MYHIFLSFVVALCLGTHWAVAATTSGEIANSLNELAQQGFAIKQLVFEINSTADAGPIPVSGSLGAQMTAHNGIQDIYTEMDTMGAVILTDVKYITNTPIITGQTEQQDVYEGYSNFVQSLLELMDAFSSSATQLKAINSTTKDKVPSEIRILQSAVDAYFYNIIGLFSAESSYNAQATNQKAQVDTHCFQAVWAFDLGSSNGSQATASARRSSSLHSRRMKRAFF